MIDAYCNLLVLLMEVYRLQNENTPDKKYASMRCIKHLMDLMFCRGFKTLDITTAMSDNMFSSNSDHLKRIKAAHIRMLLTELMQTVVDDYAVAPTNPDASPGSTERVLEQLQDSVDVLAYVLSEGRTPVAETVSAPDEEEYRDEPSLFTLEELQNYLPEYACAEYGRKIVVGGTTHTLIFVQTKDAELDPRRLFWKFRSWVQTAGGATLKSGLTMLLVDKSREVVQLWSYHAQRAFDECIPSEGRLLSVVGCIQDNVSNEVAAIIALPA